MTETIFGICKKKKQGQIPFVYMEWVWFLTSTAASIVLASLFSICAPHLRPTLGLSKPSPAHSNCSVYTFALNVEKTMMLKPLACCIFLTGALQHRQCDVFWTAGSRRLRSLLQSTARPRPLLRHRLQLL